MDQTRLQKLLEMESRNPGDAFIKFAIAQEYVSHQEDERAKGYFDALILSFPHYVPTYYQAGKLYERINDVQSAIAIYKKGIEEAKAANELKTAGELEEALMLAQDEQE